MAAQLPNGKQQFLDASGRPLVGGKVYHYIPATTTLKTTWQDAGQTTANPNPITLDAAGEAVIYGSGAYRQIVTDKNGVQIWDQLTYDPAFQAWNQSFTAQGGTQAQSLVHRAGWVLNAEDLAGVAYGGGNDCAAAFAGVAAGVTIIVSGVCRIASPITIACNLQFEATGEIRPDGGATVTYAGEITAPRMHKIFGGAGSHNLAAARFEDPTPQWFGALANGANDDTAAIQAAIDTGHTVYVPNGTYKITAALDLGSTLNAKNRMYGEGRNKSVILQATDNVQIVKFGGSYGLLKGLTLKYSNRQAVGNTGAVAVELYAVHYSVIEELSIENSYRGVMVKQAAVYLGANWIFSSSIRDLFITEFSEAAMYIVGYSGGCGGLFVENVYARSLDAGGLPQNVNNVYYLGAITESVFSCINAESCKPTEPFFIFSCANTILQSIHMEALEPRQDFGGLIHVDGGDTIISGITIYNCTFSTATYYSLLRLTSGAKLLSDALTESNSTVTVPALAVFLPSSGTKIIRAAGYNTTGTTTVGNMTDYPYQLSNYGQQYWWFNFGSSANTWINGTAAPASGTWRKGSIVWNDNPSSGSYIGWVCTAAGTPGTWTTFGPIT